MNAGKPLPIDPIAEARRQWLAHGWSSTANAMAAFSSVMRAHQLMYSRVDNALKPLGLSYARLELLRLLTFARDGSLPMSSAITRLQVHPTSISSVVERLAKDALLTRKTHPDDGRAILLSVTKQGRALADQATALLNSDVFATPGLNENDLLQLTEILSRFRKDAGDFADQ